MSVLPQRTDKLRLRRDEAGNVTDVERMMLVSDGSEPMRTATPGRVSVSVNVNPQLPGNESWMVPMWQSVKAEWLSVDVVS